MTPPMTLKKFGGKKIWGNFNDDVINGTKTKGESVMTLTLDFLRFLRPFGPIVVIYLVRCWMPAKMGLGGVGRAFHRL